MKLYLKRFRSLMELLETFPTDESCIIYLENILWHNKVISPFDKKSQVYHLGNHRYMCKNTQKIFHVKIGTIFNPKKGGIIDIDVRSPPYSRRAVTANGFPSKGNIVPVSERNTSGYT